MERPLILGSCVSRDIYNYYDESEFRIAEYYARTSFISLMSPPPSVKVDLDKIASSFQRRVVGYELSRDMLRRVPVMEFDYLLIDLIDERHNILEIEPGVFVTLTKEFRDTGYLDNNPQTLESVIECGSLRHKILWYQALERFLLICEESGVRDKIVLNRTFWADRLVTGETIPGTSEGYTARHNQVLLWMYSMLETRLNPQQILRVPTAHQVSDLGHRWGPSPFHYHDGYYRYLKARLNSLQVRQPDPVRQS